MKKLKYLGSFLLAMVVALATLASCQGYKSGDEVGKYYCDYDGNEEKLELLEDGKLTFEVLGDSLTGSYAIEGDSITIKLSNKSNLEGSYKDETLKLTYKENDLTFIRDIDYTVTFDTNGGSAIEAVTVKNGRTVAKPTDPTRVQHAFVGWTITKDGSNLFSFNDTKITKDLTIYGKWSYIKVVNTLTYVLEDGMTLNNESMNVVETMDYILEVPTIKDKTLVFAGWFLEDGTRLTDNNGKSLEPWNKEIGNVNVYAKTELNLVYEKLEDDTYKVSATREMRNLKEIKVPAYHNGKMVTELGSFENLISLETLEIPATIKNLSAKGFSGCLNLLNPVVYEVMGVEATYSVIDNVLFSNNGKTLAYYPLGSDLEEYTVPAKVNEIADYAFADMVVEKVAYGKLKKINMPKNITRIGYGAFQYRLNLNNVVFHDDSKLKLTIDDYAFFTVPLRDFTFPKNLNKIGNYSFAMDQSYGNDIYPLFGDAVFPEGLEYIGDFAFDFCKGGMEYLEVEPYVLYTPSFNSITFPKSLTHYGKYAFNKINNKECSVTFAEGSSITSIPEGLFFDAMISDINLPETIKEIGPKAFSKARIKSIDLPEGLVKISNFAFAESRLTSIKLPKSLTKIGSGAFSKCNGLKIGDINLNTNEGFVIENGLLLDSSKENILFVDSTLTEITLPGTIKYLGAGVFTSCANLTKINLNEGLVEIGDSAFEGLGKVSELTIPASVEVIGDFAFASMRSLTKLVFAEGSKLKELGNGAISKLGKITEVVLPEGLESVGSEAFSNTSLKSIVIPSTVRKIGDRAFALNRELTSVTLPKSLEVIGKMAFLQAGKLNTIILDNDAKGYKVVDNVLYTKDGKKLIAYPAGKADENYTVLDGTIEIFDGAFAYNQLIKKVVLPKSVKTIGVEGFNGAKSLEEINLENVTEILDNGFNSCKLKSVTLNENLKTLNYQVFLGTQITEIDLTHVTRILRGAFNNNRALTKVTLGSSLESIDMEAFMNCRALTQITIPGSCYQIGVKAFNGCKALSKVVISEGVESIMDKAFEGAGIKELYIPSTIRFVGSRAFTTSLLEGLTISSQYVLDNALSMNLLPANLLKLHIKNTLAINEKLATKLLEYNKVDAPDFTVYEKKLEA